MRTRTMLAAAAAAVVVVVLGPTSPAFGQGSGAMAMDCSAVNQNLGGRIVMTPSGKVLGNCWEHTSGGQGSGGGSATIVDCEEALGTPGAKGIQVTTPTGGVYTNCHVHFAM